jgi:hypothetical protein
MCIQVWKWGAAQNPVLTQHIFYVCVDALQGKGKDCNTWAQCCVYRNKTTCIDMWRDITCYVGTSAICHTISYNMHGPDKNYCFVSTSVHRNSHDLGW